MTKLTLAKARTIMDAAFAKAEELCLKPIAVAVLDSGGHVKSYAAMDGTSIMRFQIARGKAYGALAMGAGTRRINQVALERPDFIAALNAASGGMVVAVLGGVIMRTGDGEVLGAVGISGDTSEKDEVCAIAGIETAGFVADTGQA